MMKKWKKMMATVCALSMLAIMPGGVALADEQQDDDFIVSIAEDPKLEADDAEKIDNASASVEESAELVDEPALIEEDISGFADESVSAEEPLAQDAHEENVGAGGIEVGWNVMAAVNTSTGAVVLTADSTDGGLLDEDWIENLGINKGKITSIKAAASSGTIYFPEYSWPLFQDCARLKTIDFTHFDTSRMRSMSMMFYGCRSLTSINFSGFDTSNVTDMGSMFSDCVSLTKLDLRSFDTSNVEYMYSMFSNCSSLKSLNITNFDTSNVTGMSSMFSGCKSLTSLNVRRFDTSNVSSMSNMFSGCKSLTSLDVSNFDTSSVNDMGYMFSDCIKLTSLDVSNFDTSVVKYFWGMFSGCSNLITLDLRSFDTTIAASISGMFYDCKSLITLDLSSFTISKSLNDPYLFSYWDSNLCLLKTPKKNSCSIDLPATMYDSSGKAYSKMPILSKSITLTRKGGKFADVKDPTHPYYKAIYWAAGAGITKGYSNGTFGINKSCTRGEMMMFLWRFAGKPTPKTVSKSPFKDVPKNHAFYKAILWGAQNGITKGYSDGTFGVNRNVTRGACMMFLWRLKGQPKPTTVWKSPFKDVPKTHAYYKAILWGAQKKITTGYTSGAKKGTFGINENCTRGQIVTFLYRAK